MLIYLPTGSRELRLEAVVRACSATRMSQLLSAEDRWLSLDTLRLEPATDPSRSQNKSPTEGSGAEGAGSEILGPCLTGEKAGLGSSS